MSAFATERDRNLHMARVLLTQARTFRQREQARGGRGDFSQWLLNRAGNYRRAAMVPEHAVQGDLFA